MRESNVIAHGYDITTCQHDVILRYDDAMPIGRLLRHWPTCAHISSCRRVYSMEPNTHPPPWTFGTMIFIRVRLRETSFSHSSWLNWLEHESSRATARSLLSSLLSPSSSDRAGRLSNGSASPSPHQQGCMSVESRPPWTMMVARMVANIWLPLADYGSKPYQAVMAAEMLARVGADSVLSKVQSPSRRGWWWQRRRTSNPGRGWPGQSRYSRQRWTAGPSRHIGCVLGTPWNWICPLRAFSMVARTAS